jgi:small subunit ribosomal protein S16
VSVKIRLQRIGRKKQPTYRIVVTESRNPRGGKIIEVVGNYTPYRKDKPLVINVEKIDDWRSKGAITTEAVVKLLRRGRTAGGAEAKPAKTKGSAKDKAAEVAPEEPAASSPTEAA